MAGTVRENMKLRRAFYLPIPQGGIAGSYIHQSAGEGLGKIAGAVVLAPQTAGAELSGDAASSVAELGRKLSMQVVASAPRFLDKDSVTPEAMQEEEAILREQARGSGAWDCVDHWGGGSLVGGAIGGFAERFGA